MAMDFESYRNAMLQQQALSQYGLQGLGNAFGNYPTTNVPPPPALVPPKEPEFNLVLLTGDDDEA